MEKSSVLPFRKIRRALTHHRCSARRVVKSFVWTTFFLVGLLKELLNGYGVLDNLGRRAGSSGVE